MTIDQAIDYFTTLDAAQGYEERRYGACIGHLNGVIAIADEEGENGSSLEMYTADEFVAWMEAIQKARLALGGDADSIDVNELFYEHRLRKHARDCH